MSTEEIEPVEAMADFFDARADGYDDYKRDYEFEGATFAQFYGALSSPIPETDEPLRILDLGIGTGLELEFLFARAPKARITGVDLSTKMLELLRERYASQMAQITLVTDSYLTMPLGTEAYDYVISAMANHHVLHDTKRTLYSEIHTALKPGGKYVEGEAVVPLEMEGEFFAEYQREAATVPPADDGYYHIDIPFSLETQRSLLLEAGFREFEVVWREDRPSGWNMAVYVVTK
jgi:tRNA (cmo5U34)-methyltransferase